MNDWQQFVIENGWHAYGYHLAHVLGQPIDAIEAVRSSGALTRLSKKLDFVELFSKWHGRAPREDEWPAPRVAGGGYEWLSNEDALLARLVGTMPVKQICQVLTTRLQQLTGNAGARRAKNNVQTRINRLGLQAADLLGGLTTADAARVVGRVSLVNQAIFNGHLKTFRVGHRHVIPHDEFRRWLQTRDNPPDGWVRLASLMKPLGISSDSKLAEYASLGYIPTAMKVGICTKRGTWFIAPDVAAQILEDAAAGRPMPWYGKPLPGNQKAMWKKWQARKHRRCSRCARIWNGHIPRTFEAFCAKYEQLTLGDKRHLTLDVTKKPTPSSAWRPRGSVKAHMVDAGVTVYEAADIIGRRSRWIRAWIRHGLLNVSGAIVRDELGGEAIRITPLGVEILRQAVIDEDSRRDTGEWVGVHRAAHIAGVSITTCHLWRRRREVATKDGPRGILFERTSLEQRARQYWASCRFKRADAPAWLRNTSEAA